MPTFAIYKILFSRARQRSLLAEDGRIHLDHAQDYLQEAFCKAIARFELLVEVRAKMREREFWEMVDDQRERFKNFIRKVVFDFPNPDRVKPPSSRYWRK